MGGNLQHVNNMSKSLMMYGADGAGVLASSSNQMVFVIFFAMLIYGT